MILKNRVRDTSFHCKSLERFANSKDSGSIAAGERRAAIADAKEGNQSSIGDKTTSDGTKPVEGYINDQAQNYQGTELLDPVYVYAKTGNSYTRWWFNIKPTGYQPINYMRDYYTPNIWKGLFQLKFK